MAFHPIDRNMDYLLPPSVQEWLPESHLARYVVDMVEGLDLSEMERTYAGRGSDAYPTVAPVTKTSHRPSPKL